MSFTKRYPVILEAIEDSGMLSKGQKLILKTIVQCEQGLPSTSLMKILELSRQGLYFNIKKLFDRGFLIREKDSVYVYKVNEHKMIDIVETHNQIKKMNNK